MKLAGYEVWVSCNGNPLPEYSIQQEDDDGKTLTCYIPSETGKAFVIEWRDHIGSSHLSFRTKIDGRNVGGNRCHPGGKGERWGVRTNPTSRKPFQFAQLLTTEEEEFGMPCDAALGEIEISVERIRAEYRSVPRSFGKFQPVGAVHEKSKKAGVHCVSLGEERRAKTSRLQSSSTPLDRREGNVARFIFRYRPRELLQAQGIMVISEAEVPGDGPTTGKRSSQAIAGPSNAIPGSQRKRARVGYNEEDEDVKDVKAHLGEVDLVDEDEVDFKSELLNSVRKAVRKGRNEHPVPKSRSVKKEKNTSTGASYAGDVIDLTLSD